MFRLLPMSFLLGCFFVVGISTPSEARRSKRSKKVKIPDEMAQTVRTVLSDLKDNSDPKVRAAVFQGFIELGGDDRRQRSSAA